MEGLRNENGFNEEEYVKIHEGKLWAYYRQTSAKELIISMTNHYTEEAIFIINWMQDIDPRRDVILYNHHVYDINRVDDYEGYKGDLRISVKRSPRCEPEAYHGIIDE